MVVAPLTAVHPPHAAAESAASPWSLASLCTSPVAHLQHARSPPAEVFITIILKAILILIFHLREAERVDFNAFGNSVKRHGDGARSKSDKQCLGCLLRPSSARRCE